MPYIGDDVLTVLRRPFWIELESRFGNLFYVREQVSRQEEAGGGRREGKPGGSGGRVHRTVGEQGKGGWVGGWTHHTP